jgi:ornithine cyclodeaminase
MLFISSDKISTSLPYQELISALHKAFSRDTPLPVRQHHSFPGADGNLKGNLLLMPAWDNTDGLGVKLITVIPGNAEKKLPTIQGSYFLLDKETGNPLAVLDAKDLTTRRTAAASALASSFLSRKDSRTMLMIGTGRLAPELIRAHASVRPIKKVFVMGRSLEKAEKIKDELKDEDFEVSPVLVYKSFIKEVDIICCATLSQKPLIFGKDLIPGQHVDLVGAYKPNARESDDEAIKISSVYVDTIEGATKEAGDIVIPIQTGRFSKDEIKGDLFDLCQGRSKGRVYDDEITLYKSVGYALEDLVAAKLVYQKVRDE